MPCLGQACTHCQSPLRVCWKHYEDNDVSQGLTACITQKVASFKTVHIHIIYKTPTFLTLNMLVIATVYQEQVQDKVDRICLHHTPLVDTTQATVSHQPPSPPPPSRCLSLPWMVACRQKHTCHSMPGDSVLPATHSTTVQLVPQPAQGGGMLAGTCLSLRCSWTGRSFETEPSCL